jgi:hypothetical protein
VERLLSAKAHEDQSPLERFFLALANGRRLREREWVWESKFGSCTCPVCGGRGHLFWTDGDRGFVFGCKERCDQGEILDCLGLSRLDVLDVAPKWLKVR